jgi:hypothetical protein
LPPVTERPDIDGGAGMRGRQYRKGMAKFVKRYRKITGINIDNIVNFGKLHLR